MKFGIQKQEQGQQQPQTPREIALKQITSARSNLLLMLGFTLLNIILLFVEADYMLLFSATIPYAFIGAGVWENDTDILIFGVIVAVVMMGLYLLCWFMSKKKPMWLIPALILFIIDTGYLIWIYVAAGDASGILDAVFHVWVLYYLVIGTVNAFKLKKFPQEDESSTQIPDGINGAQYGSPLRTAQSDPNACIFAEHSFGGMDITYRRIGTVNELMINGFIYAEVEMPTAKPHMLSTIFNNNEIVAGYDGIYNYIVISGQKVVENLPQV